MAGRAEIKQRMGSITETKKVTDAMYMTSTVKMRRARSEVEKTEPYFDALREEIGSLLRYLPEGNDNRYFRDDDPDGTRTRALLVITADKGLAGNYNQAVIREAEAALSEHPNTNVFAVGAYGRQHFVTNKMPLEESFWHASDMPSVRRAQIICADLLARYDRGDIS